MKLAAIIRDTFREALARKTMIGFFAVSSFFLLIALLVALFVDVPQAFSGLPQAKNAPPLPLDQIVTTIEAGLTGFLNFAALFLSIFATASILPNALEKGAIDLLLSKPVSRLDILAGKFLGGLAIVLANIAWFIIGMFLIISLETGTWNWSFLAVILPLTFSFLVLWCAMLPLGIASRSSALTIILLYAFLYFISPLLHSREMLLFQLTSNEALRGLITTLYYILPKPDDIGNIAIAVVAHQPFDWMPLWSSALFATAMGALAWMLIRRKDF